jgi:hypothetical protein
MLLKHVETKFKLKETENNFGKEIKFSKLDEI